MLGWKCGDSHLDRFEGTNQRPRNIIYKPLLRFNDVWIVKYVSEELRLVERLETCRNWLSARVINERNELWTTFVAISKRLFDNDNTTIHSCELLCFPPVIPHTPITRLNCP